MTSTIVVCLPKPRNCNVQTVHAPSPGLSSRIDDNSQGGSQPTELCLHEIKIRPGCYKGRNGNNAILSHNFQQFFRDYRDYFLLFGLLFCLTTQAQRRRPQGAPIATAMARRRSLQRMVRRFIHCEGFCAWQTGGGKRPGIRYTLRHRVQSRGGRRMGGPQG